MILVGFCQIFLAKTHGQELTVRTDGQHFFAGKLRMFKKR